VIQGQARYHALLAACLRLTGAFGRVDLFGPRPTCHPCYRKGVLQWGTPSMAGRMVPQDVNSFRLFKAQPGKAASLLTLRAKAARLDITMRRPLTPGRVNNGGRGISVDVHGTEQAGAKPSRAEVRF